MTNYSHGHDAEKVAAEYLKKQGYKIIELNWRHARAEIDIIAQKKRGPMIFFEVKYRQNDAQGSGLDYITTRKLTQMRYAANLWVTENEYDGEISLGAMELTGDDYLVTKLIEELH